MLEWCNFVADGDTELDLHHEFNQSAARANNTRVSTLVQFITSIANPFDNDNKLRNVCTGSSIPSNVAEGILKCVEVGEHSYQDYRQARFVEKSKKLHDTILTNRNVVTPKPTSTEQPIESLQTKTIAAKNDMADALRYIDYARERQYDMTKLLKCEIKSTSYYLVENTKKGCRVQTEKE